ncbi:hypothetical protein V6Z11_1Z065600 [Gossypium hirsutum]
MACVRSVATFEHSFHRGGRQHHFRLFHWIQRRVKVAHTLLPKFEFENPVAPACLSSKVNEKQFNKLERCIQKAIYKLIGKLDWCFKLFLLYKLIIYMPVWWVGL